MFKKTSLSLLTVLLCSCANFAFQDTTAVKETAKESNTDKAIVYMVKGDLDSALLNVTAALKDNPDDPYALMVAGIVYDMMGIPHKARRYYEDIIEGKYTETSMLDNFSFNAPKPLNEAALKRLKAIEVKKVPFAIHGTEVITPEMENLNGARPNMTSAYDAKTEQASMLGGGNGMNDTYIKASKQFNAQPVSVENSYGTNDTNAKTIYAGNQIFSGTDKNIVNRFVTFKRLFDEGLVTKEEYLARRTPNIGGLMPLSNPQPSIGIDRPIPDPEVIVDRLKALKTAFEIKAISAREYASERNLILDSLLPPAFKDKMVPPKPPEDILAGAEAIRRLEVLREQGLISDSELEKEKKAVERVVQFGINPKKDQARDKSTLVPPSEKKKVTPKKIIPGVSKPKSMR